MVVKAKPRKGSKKSMTSRTILKLTQKTRKPKLKTMRRAGRRQIMRRSELRVKKAKAVL